MIPDNFWEKIKIFIPSKKSKVGRPKKDPKTILNGIIYVLQSGCQWRLLPKEFSSKSTVHGTFMHWVRSGVFKQIMEKMIYLYEEKRERFGIWYAVDASSCKAPFASSWGGKNPTDRAKFGVKKHLIIDQRGAPMAVAVGPANRHDSKGFDLVFSEFTAFSPDKLNIMAGDSAYDAKKIRKKCKSSNFILFATTNRRNSKKPIELIRPAHRWLVERTFGWLNWFRSLQTCWAKTQISFLAFFQFACSLRLFRMS